MAKNGDKGTKLGKAALAKISSITSGETTINDPRVSPLSQSLGITYNSNNTVVNNQTNANISDLQTKDILLENKINILASILGVTFNADGTLNTEAYSTHTHDYDDDGVIETTAGVN